MPDIQKPGEIQQFIDEIQPNWVSSQDMPLVSIIIPVFGKLEITLACIKSISQFQQESKFEIIIVDDCSPDDSGDWLAKLPKVKVVRNNSNLGFIDSCNVGADIANGHYLHFLNNDTIVTERWLDELVLTFGIFSDVGMVGSKLLYPDGSLQEAGGIIWRDGSAWNFGNGDFPSRPEYSYARQVDYCSGASLLIEKALFQKFNGFDQLYKPAYCEDADLALKITASGLKVVYQPSSVVYHIEGATSGRETSSGAKSYQIQNTKKLSNRWSAVLKSHSPNGVSPMIEKDRFARKRVLVVDHSFPMPDKDAGSVTSINTMLLLRQFGFQVTFATPTTQLIQNSYSEQLSRFGIEVLVQPYVDSLRKHLQTEGSRYDLVFVFRPDVLQSIYDDLKFSCSDAPVVFHTVDLHFLRLKRQAEIEANTKLIAESSRYKELELDLIRKVDLAIVHSEVEFSILTSEGVDEKSLYVFPLIMNVPKLRKDRKNRTGIVYIGNFQHVPNVDAVKFLCSEIMPALLKINPEIELSVVGSNPTDEIKNLETNNVKVLGYLESISEIIESSVCSVAPLRYGAGIKGKVGMSLAHGTPVIGTSIAFEGMLIHEGEGVISANQSEDFALAIARIYSNPEEWDKLSIFGHRLAETLWGSSAATENMGHVLERVGIVVDLSPSPIELF